MYKITIIAVIVVTMVTLAIYSSSLRSLWEQTRTPLAKPSISPQKPAYLNSKNNELKEIIGPRELHTGERGMWTMRIIYSKQDEWGLGKGILYTATAKSVATSTQLQNTTDAFGYGKGDATSPAFTHTFTESGMYEITFEAKGLKSQRTSTTLNVQVKKAEKKSENINELTESEKNAILNGEYVVGDVGGERMKFTNGELNINLFGPGWWRGVHVFPSAVGDINKDGRKDVVVNMSAVYGGSGIASYLSIINFDDEGKAYEVDWPVKDLRYGDRESAMNISIKNSHVFIESILPKKEYAIMGFSENTSTVIATSTTPFSQ